MGMEYALRKASSQPTDEGESSHAVEAKTMQTIHKFDAAHFIHLFYDASLLIFYVFNLTLVVTLVAYGLEMLSSAL